MGRRHLLYLLYTSSAGRPPPSYPPYFNAPPPPPPPSFLNCKGYSQESSKSKEAYESMSHEKAPSTLEEFKRIEEEKASEGVVSQTVEKAEDGAMEAVTGDDSVDSVKESFKRGTSVGSQSKDK